MDQSSYLLDETYSRLNFKQFSRCAGAQVLQLEDVRGQVVGDGGARGISGGQRKRVNLGLELVAAPALLLLGALGTMTQQCSNSVKCSSCNSQRDLL